MKIEKKPIGQTGMAHVMAEVDRIFEKAAKNGGKEPKTTWPEGFVPTVTETEEISVPCPYCDETGMRYVGTHGDHEQWGPQLYGKCPTCDGTRKIRHRFPREIVKLAKAMEGQSALIIARTLCGLKLGFRLEADPNELR